MHGQRTVRAALELASAGANATDVARQLGIPRRTVSGRLRGVLPHSADSDRRDRCGRAHVRTDVAASYAYLLGLYLGDGCISRHPRDVYKLRIFLDVKYPEIIAGAAATMKEVKGGPVAIFERPENCVEVYAYWKCWPCLFPQHGPGKKHKRPIALSDWQLRLVERWPECLLRGLVHSDGCRFESMGRGNWSSPRYTFTNYSPDILRIFCRACEQIGLHWTASGEHVIYVSRKADVAILDEFIGPKR